MGNNAYIAHVGDTRAYLFKQAELKQITQDHSLARRLQETGQASTDELMSVQNVLYKAIGQGSTLEDEDIQHVMSTASAPQEACEELVTLANKKGGPDNITAVIVSVGAENQADA